MGEPWMHKRPDVDQVLSECSVWAAPTFSQWWYVTLPSVDKSVTEIVGVFIYLRGTLMVRTSAPHATIRAW